MSFDVSVVVLTYYPDKVKLISTIKSVLLQENVSFEILIADDGSDDFFKEDIKKIMSEYNFTDFKFIDHSENQGTVINFYDAVMQSSGRIIKPISPGDYLYDNNTLFKVCNFMDEQDADAAFGDLIYYSNDGKFVVYDKLAPIYDKLYLDYNAYNSGKIAKYLIKYSDSICGAALFYRSSILREYLPKVIGTVIYAEDAITQILALESKRILKIKDFVVFYEYGTGISTQGVFNNNRMLSDFIRFYELLIKMFPKKRYIKNAIKRFNLFNKNKRISYYLYRLTTFGNNIYSLKQKFVLLRYKCDSYNTKFFDKVNKNNKKS